MDYINNGEYYLIARYSDNNKEIIDINRKWYCGGEKVMQTGVDIAAIDIITTKFSSMDELKKRLFENKYIKDMNVDLYIVHKNKYSNKEYLNEYELLVNNSERTKFINEISKNRLKNGHIEFNDINNFLNKFITKSLYIESFLKLISCPWIKIDEEIKEQLLKSNKEKKESLIADPNKKVKPNYSIKYRYQGKFTSYTILRNIVSAWNTYDEIEKEFAKENPDYKDSDLEKVIINKYIELLKIKDPRKEIHEELRPMVDKKNVKGQITIDDYLKEKASNNDSSNSTIKPELKVDEYRNSMDQMYRDSREIRESVFDDSRLKMIEAKFGRENVIKYLDNKILNSLGDADRYRLGFIDYVTYKNSMRNNNGKRHS